MQNLSCHPFCLMLLFFFCWLYITTVCKQSMKEVAGCHSWLLESCIFSHAYALNPSFLSLPQIPEIFFSRSPYFLKELKTGRAWKPARVSNLLISIRAIIMSTSLLSSLLSKLQIIFACMMCGSPRGLLNQSGISVYLFRSNFFKYSL